MKQTLILILMILCFIIGMILENRLSSNNSSNQPLIISTNPNRIVLSNYDIRNNLYSVIYIQNNDTLALDYLHPLELDSLINELNSNN